MQVEMFLRYCKACRKNLMIWVSFSWNGVVKLTFVDDKMDTSVYYKILSANLQPSTKKLKMENNFILQQEFARKANLYFDTNYLNIWNDHPKVRI